MKQHIQQTASPRALQPVVRTIKTGLEQFDISDTDENIQEAYYANNEQFEELKEKGNKRKARLQSIVEHELAEPTQIGNMISSSSTSSIIPILQSYDEQTSKNLRGSNQKVGYVKTSSSSAEQLLDIPFEEVIPGITQDIQIDALKYLPTHRISQLRATDGDY
jgi:hypothetical protein